MLFDGEEEDGEEKVESLVVSSPTSKIKKGKKRILGWYGGEKRKEVKGKKQVRKFFSGSRNKNIQKNAFITLLLPLLIYFDDDDEEEDEKNEKEKENITTIYFNHIFKL